VAIDEAGGHTVAWTRAALQESNIWARRYSATGAPLAEELRVNASTGNLASGPAVTVDSQGNLVVVWRASASGGDSSIYGRAFDAQGLPLGEDFEISTAPWFQGAASVSRHEPAGRDELERFVVTWESGGSQDSTIQARLYAMGTPTPTPSVTPTPRLLGGPGDPQGGGLLPLLALSTVLAACIPVLRRRSAANG
jgi:hypothetical protein